jgi:hypothetical protein
VEENAPEGVNLIYQAIGRCCSPRMSAASEFRTSQLVVEVLPSSEVPCVYCEIFNLMAQIGHMLLGECPICDEMKYFGVTQGTRADATHEFGSFVDSLESCGGSNAG